MSRDQRIGWLLRYMSAGRARSGVDVLDLEFVDNYVESTGASVNASGWGADKCRQLGADLSTLVKKGYAQRFSIGLGGNWQPGFPRWVWSYRITATGIQQAAKAAP